MKPEIATFVHEGLGNSSYLLRVGDGEAVLVDPDRTVARYLDAAEERGLRIVGSLETHLHADFVSGALEVARRVGARPIVAAEAGVGFEAREVRPDERLELGDVEIQVLHTPGHTPEHLSFVVRTGGEDAPSLFSGGALIVGGAARTDLIDPAMTDRLTRALHRSVREAYADLPDDTLVLPTHGGGSFCSVSTGGERTSSLGAERRGNPVLTTEDEEGFARWFPTTFPGTPTYFFRLREVNRSGPTPLDEIPAPPGLTPAAVADAVAAGAQVVDVRPTERFAAGHVPGALSNPFRGSFATWLGWLVPPEVPLVFVLDGEPLDRVVEEALLVGYERFGGSLEGGMVAWEADGRDLARAELIPPERAAALLHDGAVAVDVREPSEVERGAIPGALTIPLGDLADRLDEVPSDRPVVAYCALGERSSSAMSIFQAAGRAGVSVLEGGYTGWRKARPAPPAR